MYFQPGMDLNFNVIICYPNGFVSQSDLFYNNQIITGYLTVGWTNAIIQITTQLPDLSCVIAELVKTIIWLEGYSNPLPQIKSL